MYRTATAVDAAGTAAAPEYDSDDNLVVADKQRGKIEALRPLEHEQIEYDDFTKDFYVAAPDIAAMTEGQVSGFRCRCTPAHVLMLSAHSMLGLHVLVLQQR